MSLKAILDGQPITILAFLGGDTGLIRLVYANAEGEIRDRVLYEGGQTLKISVNEEQLKIAGGNADDEKRTQGKEKSAAKARGV